MSSGSRQLGKWEIGIGAAVLAALLIAAMLLHYRAYLKAPGTHDMTNEQRTATLRSAVKAGGVPALREQGGLRPIHRGEIATVGASRCVGEHECFMTVSTRRGPDRCDRVITNLYCAYEIVDTAGEPAAALVKTTRGSGNFLPDISPGDPEWLYELVTTEPVDEGTALHWLCRMGYCSAASLARWKPAPVVVPPDAHGHVRGQCPGILAHVIGQGMTCLDPGNREMRSFRDCSERICGPEMVVVPPGRYQRGTSQEEIAGLRRDFPAYSDLGKSEHPQVEVTIGYPLAVGRLEITFEEWEACLLDGQCKARGQPEDNGFGRGGRPVINVSWNDIVEEYLPWLNGRLGLTGAYAYRLPSDGEWEYAARAGTSTRYAFGDALTEVQARFHTGPPGSPRGTTAPAGSFPANAFGLHDMHGNVAEWVADCFGFIDDAADLPKDGTAARSRSSSGECSSRAYRGGSFAIGPELVRSAVRGYADPTSRHVTLGFRVARRLDERGAGLTRGRPR